MLSCHTTFGNVLHLWDLLMGSPVTNILNMAIKLFEMDRPNKSGLLYKAQGWGFLSYSIRALRDKLVAPSKLSPMPRLCDTVIRKTVHQNDELQIRYRYISRGAKIHKTGSLHGLCNIKTHTYPSAIWIHKQQQSKEDEPRRHEVHQHEAKTTLAIGFSRWGLVSYRPKLRHLAHRQRGWYMSSLNEQKISTLNCVHTCVFLPALPSPSPYVAVFTSTTSYSRNPDSYLPCWNSLRGQ